MTNNTISRVVLSPLYKAYNLELLTAPLGLIEGDYAHALMRNI